MNKMTLAAMAAALCLTGLAQQRAAAQCCPPPCQRGGDISFNVGVTLGCRWNCNKGHWVPDCPACYGPAMPYGYPPYGYPPPFRTPLPPAIAAPNPPAALNPPKAPENVQNIGYNYPAGNGANYGYGYGYTYGIPYGQAPSYWYGR